jgi:hypothetical protein
MAVSAAAFALVLLIIILHQRTNFGLHSPITASKMRSYRNAA